MVNELNRDTLIKDLLFPEKKSITVSEELPFPQALQQVITERNNTIQKLQQYVKSFISSSAYCGEESSTLNQFLQKWFDIHNDLINSPISVAIVGRGNSGKSMLISQLLANEIKLPQNEDTHTIRVTRIVYSETDVFKEINPKEPKKYVREQPLLNKTQDYLDLRLNRQRHLLNNDVIIPTIAELGLNNDLLKSGVQLMDFPSFNERTLLKEFIFKTLKSFQPSLICYVYQFNSGFSLEDAEIVMKLHNVKDKMTQILVVANQIDMVLDDDEEVADVIRFDSQIDSKSDDMTEKIQIAEKEVKQNCQDKRNENRYKYLNFECDQILPIVPLSAFRLAFMEENASDTKYLKMLADFENEILNKIFNQAKNYLQIIAEIIRRNCGEYSLKYIIPLWCHIQSLMLQQSLVDILNSQTFYEDYRCIDFTNGYRVSLVTIEGSTFHITSIRNKPSGGVFDFEDDQAVEIIVHHWSSPNPNDCLAYLSTYKSTVFIIKQYISHPSLKRVVDCLDELSTDNLQCMLREIVEINSVPKLKYSSRFRPDNVYCDYNDLSHCFMSSTIPIELPLILKNEFVTWPYHFMKKWDEIELSISLIDDNDCVEGIEFAEFVYSFGWFVWMVMEGSGRQRVDTVTYDPESWVKLIPTERLNHQFPEFYLEVMKLCWSVTRADHEGNDEKWFRVLQLFDDENQLFNAVYHNKSDRIQKCMDHGVDVNKQFQSAGGYTPLCLSADNGLKECVKQLLLHGADPDRSTENGFTPLMFATMRGYTEVIKLLLRNNANPNLAMIKAAEGQTPLHLAVQYGRVESVKELLEHKPTQQNEDTTNEATLAKCLNRVQHKLNINQKKSNGSTALFDAAMIGSVNIVKLLISHGADLTIIDEHGMSPLYIAAKKGKLECLKYIFKQFCENIQNNRYDEKTFESFHTQREDTKCLQDLLKKHYLNFQAKDGTTPLMEACQEGHSNCVEFLLDMGADPNIQYTENGSTAVHLTVAHGYPDCLKLLLKRKASLSIRTANGLQAIHVAAQEGKLECLNLLIDNNVDLNAISPSGRSPLFFAAEFNRVDLVETLLKQNADPIIRDVCHLYYQMKRQYLILGL